MILRFAPILTISLLIVPIFIGLVGILIPAFGYLPAIGGETFSLDPFHRLFSEPGFMRSLWLSFFIGFASTGITFIIVIFFLAAWGQSRFFTMMRSLISPLLSIPHAAAAFGLAFLIAPSGWIARLMSPWLTGWTQPPDLLILADPLGLSMIAALVIKEIPFLLLVTIAAIPQTEANKFLRVTGGLGYGRIAGFLLVVMPRLYPQIRLPIYAVIAYAVSVVDVALVLGPTTPAPLAIRIFQWSNDPDLTMRFVAAAGSLLLVVITILAISTWILMEHIAFRICRFIALSGWRFTQDQSPSILAAILAAGSVAAIGLGAIILGLWSIAGRWRFADIWPANITMRHWEQQVHVLLPSLQTTLMIALCATILALVLALGCLEYENRRNQHQRKQLTFILYLPLLVPQVSFLFGLQIFFLKFHLDSTFLSIVFSHFIFVLPYMFLALSDPWRALNPRYAETAANLGSQPWRIFWRIRLPLLLTPILTCIAIGFAVSIGQYLPTIIAGGGRFQTITTEAIALASGGNRRIIGVTALIQMILPFIGFWIALAIPALLYKNRRDMKAAL